jgi:hypothetical protein
VTGGKMAPSAMIAVVVPLLFLAFFTGNALSASLEFPEDAELTAVSTVYETNQGLASMASHDIQKRFNILASNVRTFEAFSLILFGIVLISFGVALRGKRKEAQKGSDFSTVDKLKCGLRCE